MASKPPSPPETPKYAVVNLNDRYRATKKQSWVAIGLAGLALAVAAADGAILLRARPRPAETAPEAPCRDHLAILETGEAHCDHPKHVMDVKLAGGGKFGVICSCPIENKLSGMTQLTPEERAMADAMRDAGQDYPTSPFAKDGGP